MFSCYGKQFCHLVYALTGIDAWQGDKRLRRDLPDEASHIHLKSFSGNHLYGEDMSTFGSSGLQGVYNII
jgi:hypothetical protein